MQNETSIDQTSTNEQGAAILVSGSRHYRLDLPGKRITFLDKRFYFDEGGNAVPSVTTILEAYPKGAAFFEWLKKNGENSDEIRDEAGRRGSVVHGLTEKFDKGEEVSLLNGNGEIQFSMLEWAMFERYVEFREANPEMRPIMIEQNFVDGELGYGGTVDRIFEFRGRRILLDIKTSSLLHEHFFLQLSAYKKMANKSFIAAGDHEFLKAHHVDEVAILWLNAKTRTDKAMPAAGACGPCQGKGWQFVPRDTADQIRDFTRFEATRMLWLAENEDAKPREASYKLIYQALTEEERVAKEKELITAEKAAGKSKK